MIAAKNSKGTILWSWHIWLAEEGWEESVYPNDAGTMMDRNLGATTSDTELVGSKGLLYQWGRKDPFLGSSSMSDPVPAVSTGVWSVSSSEFYNIEECVPMVLYTHLLFNSEDLLWNSNKTVYDPCPAGWRVPDGGDDGIWAVAGISSNQSLANEYPRVFCTYIFNGSEGLTGISRYWSVTTLSLDKRYALFFDHSSATEWWRCDALAVRCQKDVQK